MKEINFKKFKIYKGISKKQSIIEDASEVIANIFYNKATGMQMHTIAHKIFDSDGPTEFDEEEIKTIIEVTNQTCTPAFIDSLNDNIIE